MLADVDGGSDTPSLVGKVLKWRKEKFEDGNDPRILNPFSSLTSYMFCSSAGAVWKYLDQLNQSLAHTLLHLSRLHDQDPSNYKSAVKYISTLQPVQWEANPLQPPAEQPIVNTFYQAHRISQVCKTLPSCSSENSCNPKKIQEIRFKMKEMGTLAGVPIEPDEQTRLLDVCVTQAGVVGGGVPGAGGYDAIWLLICDPESSKHDQSPLDRIEHVWSTYKELDVSPLSSAESYAKGIRLEKLDEIPGLGMVIGAP